MDAEKIKQFYGWFKAENTACLGIFCQDGKVQLTLAELRDDDIVLTWQETVKADDTDSEDNLCEELSVRLRAHTEENVPCWLVLDGENIFYYEKVFPDMQRRELEQALAFDFAANSGWTGKYLWSYEQVDADMFRLGGMQREQYEKLTRSWQKYFSLRGVILFCQEDEGHMACVEAYSTSGNADGCRESVYGAVAGLTSMGLMLKGKHEFRHRWNWLRVGTAFAVLNFGVMTLGGIAMGYASYESGKELRQQQEEQSLLSDVAMRQQSIEEMQSLIRSKERIMGRIHEEKMIGHGLLVNMGDYAGDGVWLTGISVDGGHKMILQGKAVGYNQVTRFLEVLQADKNYFDGKIALVSSDVGQDGYINFQLNGKL